VAQNSALQTKIIHSFHATAIGGHSGVQATYHRVHRLFYWKGLKSAVEDFVKQCQICQQVKHLNSHPAGLLQPLPIPEGAWQDLSMDFIEGLPKSEGYEVILVVVDRFTKYAHFITVKHPFTAPTIARAVFDNVIKLHGMPKTIVSDRDKVFTSVFWKELFRLLGTTLMFSSAYHPQTNGQTERVNQCLEMYLRCLVYDTPKKWKSMLAQEEFWYNSTFHFSLGCSPFQALYGYAASFGTLPDLQSTSSSVTDTVQELKSHTLWLKEHLARAQNKMKLQADRNRTDREFQVGEQVLLKLQPYAQSSVVNRPCPKLALKYFGPFTVEAKIGRAAYRLDLPDHSQIHPVFHVSQLKPFLPNYTPVFSELPKIAELDAHDLKPNAILERRLVKKGAKAIPQALIKWST